MDYLQTFRERRDCFSELLALSHEQMSLIEAAEYSQLLSILGRKQRIIGRLEEIHRLHPDFPNDWKRHREALTPAARTVCDKTLAETETLLSQLMTLERQGTDRLVEHRQQTRVELHSVTAGSRAQSAYGHPHGAAAHRFLNVDQ